MTWRRGLAFAALCTALASCVPQAGQRPAAPPPAPPPPAPPAPLAADWHDWPVTPGAWTYSHQSTGTSTARFSGGLWLACDLAARRLALGRTTAAPSDGMLTIVTDAGTLRWPARPATGGVEAFRAANDPGLDQIAYARGRFAVELPGTAPVVAPAWAEVARVIEDCRE